MQHPPRPYEGRSTRDAVRRPIAEADALGADEELVAGRRPVEEAFRAGRPARRLLVVPQRRQALERIVLHATNLRIPIVEIEGGTLTSLAGFDGHQGVAVVVDPRRYATLDDVLARAIELGEPPFVLALDSLEDPQNVGTLLRSAEAAGAHGVLFPTHRQAPLSPAAVKASAGAVEHLLLCPVDDLAAALADLHIRGLRIAGAEEDAPLTVRQADLRGPLAIVVGSEGQGLGPAVRRRCDVLMRIPMVGAIESLNAAVAGSVLLFEALAQRDPSGTARRRQPRPLFAASAAGVAPADTTRIGTVPADDGAAATESAGAVAGASDEEADPGADPETMSRVEPAEQEREAAEPEAAPGGSEPPARPEPGPGEPEPLAPEPHAAPGAEAAAPEGERPERERKARARTRAKLPAADSPPEGRPARKRAAAGRPSRASEPSEPSETEQQDDRDDDLLPGGPPAAPSAGTERP